MHHSFCIIVCYRAVRSAILATAGLLVSLRVSVRVRVRVSISIYLIDGIKLRIGSVLTNNIRKSAVRFLPIARSIIATAKSDNTDIRTGRRR